MFRLGVSGRKPLICIVLLGVMAVGCGGSSSGQPVSITPTPAYSKDCRAVDAVRRPSQGPVQYTSMVVDQKLRDYRLYQPPALDLANLVPLVVVLHGSPLDADGFESLIHFQSEARIGGFLAVYPDGCDENWSPAHDSYDVHFVAKIVDRLESKFHIDHSRVYAVGGSAGAVMAYRLACDLAERFTAIAAVAGEMSWNDCGPVRPISVLEMHGTADTILRYENVPGLIQRWVSYDGCVGDPVISQVGITKTSLWKDCRGGTTVRLDTVVGGHHTWFGSTFDPVDGEPRANTVVWDFLKQFTLG